MRALVVLEHRTILFTLLKQCVLLFSTLCAIGAAYCDASPIVYTVSGSGDGVFGFSFFHGLSFTITSIADTSQVHKHEIYENNFVVPNQLTTVSVSGLGSLTVRDQTVTLVNQNAPRAGIYAPLFPQTGLFVDSAALANYDLRTPFSHVVGTPTYNAGMAFSTTDGGQFELFWVANDVAFQAVPEPSAIELLGFCTLLLCMFSGRQVLSRQ